MPILSVIIPVYNVSEYLREGLDSILNQDVQDIEVICVDDCSTDDSLCILRDYQKRYKRIVIKTHIQNRGPSATRNTGIKIAKGKYIAFFDPDDMACQNFYTEMLKTMEEKNVDVVMSGFATYPEGHVVIPNFPPNIAMEPKAFLGKNKIIHTSNDLCFSWRFLFKRSLLEDNNILFNEKLRIGEDMPFNLTCLLKATSVIMLPITFYKYRTSNSTSLMSLKFKSYLEDNLQLQIKEKKRIIKEYELDKYTPITKDMSEDIVRRYTTMLFDNLRNNPNEPDKKMGIVRILSMSMVREAMRVVGFRNIYPSWKEYVFYLAMKFGCTQIVQKVYFK